MISTATSPPAESATSPSPLIVSRTLGTVVVTLHGQVDGSISSLLAAVLRDLIEGQGNQSIVVDLSDLHRLHDSAVDVLLSAAHTSSWQGSHPGTQSTQC